MRVGSRNSDEVTAMADKGYRSLRLQVQSSPSEINIAEK